MSGSFLLDTNVVIAIFAQDAAVQKHLTQADEVFVPAIVLGELYFGARKSARAEANITRIDEFAASNTVLDCNAMTAQEYGRIKNVLREKGHPIPENDIWIAATAQEHSLTLVSRDAHFDEVEGLRVEFW